MRFRNTMENKLNKMLGREVKIGLASIDKERITHINGDDKLISATVTGGDDIIGDVDGKRVIILDDLIASGKTIGTSVAAIKRDGGQLWAAAATHGVFVGEADEHLKEVPRPIIADTIPPFRLDRDSWKDRLHVIPTAKIFAQAIRRTHEHGSISELIQA